MKKIIVGIFLFIFVLGAASETAWAFGKRKRGELNDNSFSSSPSYNSLQEWLEDQTEHYTEENGFTSNSQGAPLWTPGNQNNQNNNNNNSTQEQIADLIDNNNHNSNNNPNNTSFAGPDTPNYNQENWSSEETLSSHGAAVVPEPATITLMGIGLAGGAFLRRRKK